MAEATFDVLGIGNAIFDILSHVNDDVLVRNGLAKGRMALVDADGIRTVYDQVAAAVRVSGGSAGNTIAGVASLGGKAAFIGKVAADEFGEAYRHDMRALGIHFETAPLAKGTPTASCLVLVTPDGERTMNTFLGASVELAPADVEPKTVEAAAITFLEGYLFDPEDAKEAFRRAAEIAKAAGRQVALSLSDVFCVERNRADFLALLEGGAVDILFANEHEARALYETSDLESAVAELQKTVPLTAVTMGEKGALIVTRESRDHVEAALVEEVVDLTGAGDLFAGGFLFGLARGLDLRTSAEIGAIAAAEVIGHLGARPERNLADLVRQSGIEI